MEKIVDQAWALLLAGALKKRGVLRPDLGDDIDLCVPQSRLLALVESNPAMPKLLYSSAEASARRNAFNIVRKLGMPADYFWKFEYWPKARALTTLGQIVKRVFSSMMAQAKEGGLEVTDLDIDPLRFSIKFENCVECAGISGLEYAICYYHAGTFSGILSSLINRDLASFETACLARGDESCRFIVGDVKDTEIKTGHEPYLAPPQISSNLASRLEKGLSNLPVRAQGNMVDVIYHQLVMVSTLLADPQRLASTSLEVGCQFGRRLAPLLAKAYGQAGLQNMSSYYSQVRGLAIEVKESAPQLQLVIRECAESSGGIKEMEVMSFLFGELQGLTSELTGREMALTESRFEDGRLLITLAPKA